MSGRVFVPKGFDWDRSISGSDQDAIIERVLRLPAWVGAELGTDNLDVKKLEGRELWRLRVGNFRAVTASTVLISMDTERKVAWRSASHVEVHRFICDHSPRSDTRQCGGGDIFNGSCR